MTSPQARKGSQFERDVVAYLRAHGQPFAERAYGAGRPADVGDVDGIPGWTIECKNHRSLELSAWLSEAEAEAEGERENGRRRWAAVIFKRRGRTTADAYVLVSLDTFARMLSEGDQ